MEIIDKGNGVYEFALAEGETEIRKFYKYDEFTEVHIPEGAESTADGTFTYCENLKRVYIPKSMKMLGDAMFYGLYHTIEIYYAGTAEEFRELGKAYKKVKDVQVPGKYDVQPFCNTEGTYYEKKTVLCSFSSFAYDIQVITADGERLQYGQKA